MNGREETGIGRVKEKTQKPTQKKVLKWERLKLKSVFIINTAVL